MKKVITLAALVAALSGCAVKSYSDRDTELMTYSAQEKGVTEFKLTDAMPSAVSAHTPFTATATQTLFPEAVNQKNYQTIETALPQMEALLAVEETRLLSLRDVTTQSAAALAETYANRPLMLAVLDEVATRTTALHNTLYINPEFVPNIDETLYNLERRAQSGAGVDATQAQRTVARFRDVAKKLEGPLYGEIAAREVSGNYGSQLARLLDIHEAINLAQGNDTRLRAKNVFAHLEIDSAELKKDLKGVHYLFELHEATENAGWSITDAYDRGKLDNERTGITLQDKTAGLIELVRYQNAAAVEQDMLRINDAERAELRQAWYVSGIPLVGLGISFARDPWTTNYQLALPNRAVHTAITGIFERRVPNVFSGAGPIWEDRGVGLATTAAAVLITGYEMGGKDLFKNNDEIPTGKGGITPTTPGVDSGNGTGSIGSGAGVQ